MVAIPFEDLLEAVKAWMRPIKRWCYTFYKHQL